MNRFTAEVHVKVINFLKVEFIIISLLQEGTERPLLRHKCTDMFCWSRKFLTHRCSHYNGQPSYRNKHFIARFGVAMFTYCCVQQPVAASARHTKQLPPTPACEVTFPPPQECSPRHASSRSHTAPPSCASRQYTPRAIMCCRDLHLYAHSPLSI